VIKLAYFVSNFVFGIDWGIQVTRMGSTLAVSKRLCCCLFQKFHSGYHSYDLSFAALVLFILALAWFVSRPLLPYSERF
jgi:hypothetical protein